MRIVLALFLSLLFELAIGSILPHYSLQVQRDGKHCSSKVGEMDSALKMILSIRAGGRNHDLIEGFIVFFSIVHFFPHKNIVVDNRRQYSKLKLPALFSTTVRVTNSTTDELENVNHIHIMRRCKKTHPITSRGLGVEKKMPHVKQAVNKAWKRLQFEYSENRLEYTIFLSYVCVLISISSPTVLLPEILADFGRGKNTATLNNSALAVKIASISSIGGAIGKFVNGFFVQFLGGRKSALIYFAGLTSFSVLLSNCTEVPVLAVTLAGLEFFASIMWTAFNVILLSHFEKQPDKLTKGVTLLSLGSTVGTIGAKIGLTALLSKIGWRYVALSGAVCGTIGFLLVKCNLTEVTPTKFLIRNNRKCQEVNQNKKKQIFDSIQDVTSNPLFWRLGLGHSMAFLIRNADKILGSFYCEVGNIAPYICGGLTSSMTLGFIHGLISGRKYGGMNLNERKIFIKKRYRKTIASILSLSVCSLGWFQNFIGPMLVTTVIALSSALMASSIAVQFYRLPGTFAPSFGENRAVCISFVDGLGFLVCVPSWSFISKLIEHNFGGHGWFHAWLFIAAMITVSSKSMMSAIDNFSSS